MPDQKTFQSGSLLVVQASGMTLSKAPGFRLGGLLCVECVWGMTPFSMAGSQPVTGKALSPARTRSPYARADMFHPRPLSLGVSGSLS